jgi:hypothetical protein
MRQFSHDNPIIDKEWFNNSNYICLLSVADEQELNNLILKAKNKEIALSEFREPDLNNSLTAICLAPGQLTKKIVSGLKLAFS